MEVLKPIITDEGKRYLMQDFASAKENYRISKVELGTGQEENGYLPTVEKNKRKKLFAKVLEGKVETMVENGGHIQITSVIGKTNVSGTTTIYEIREIGFYMQKVDKQLADEGEPVLFAIYARDFKEKTENDKNVLLPVDGGTELLLAFDLAFPMDEKNLPFNSDAFVSIPSATIETAGTVKLATIQDAQDGISDKVITARVLKQVVTEASTENLGLVELATVDEAKSGSGNKVITAQTLKAFQDAIPKIGDATTFNKGVVQFADDNQVKDLNNNNVVLSPKSLNDILLNKFLMKQSVMSPGYTEVDQLFSNNASISVLRAGRINPTHIVSSTGGSITTYTLRVKDPGQWENLVFNGNSRWKSSNTLSPPQALKDSLGFVHLSKQIKAEVISVSSRGISNVNGKAFRLPDSAKTKGVHRLCVPCKYSDNKIELVELELYDLDATISFVDESRLPATIYLDGIVYQGIDWT